MAKRVRTATAVEVDVITASRRRCCVCVYLFNREDVRNGQLAHLNRNPADARFDNLVYLCLEHHDDYDTKRSQSKGLLPEEVRRYRDQLYAKYKTGIFGKHPVVELAPLAELSQYKVLQKKFDDKLGFLSKPWRYPLWQVANEPQLFAYKSGNRCDGICLIERIDLPDERIVIVCIQPAGNPGNSITNNVEFICFQVCARFDISAERLVWLEHYDYDKRKEWTRVTFRRTPPLYLFEEPEWTPMTPTMWRDLRLRPKRKPENWRGHYGSKITKLFPWPTEAIL